MSKKRVLSIQEVLLLWCCAIANTAQYGKENWHFAFPRKNDLLFVGCVYYCPESFENENK